MLLRPCISGMNNDDSMALLREYAQSNSEQAFATLVSQYVNLVYSVALRQVRDPHWAEEITQTVFIVLARKAKSLSSKTILPGWLCRTARYVSSDAQKIQRRRQFREQESHMQSTLNQSDSEAWNQIAPLLDDALGHLGEKEHDAIVLRFLGGKELKQVGAAMGISEDAARMRVNRGLEKLRGFFTRKGKVLSAAAIAGAVSANSVQAAPAALAASIATAVFSGTTLTTTAAIAAVKTIAMTTLQKTVTITALAVAVGTGLYQARQAARTQAELQRLQQQQEPLTEQFDKLKQERDEVTRQLASLRSDEQSNRATAELVKLRGEVSTLRRQNDDVQALQQENRQLRNRLNNVWSTADRAAYNQQEENVFNDMAELLKAMRQHASQHTGIMATNFAQLIPFLSLKTNQDGSQTVLPSGASLGNFEFMNAGLATETTPQMLVLRERNPRKAPGGDWGRIYGFADGSVQKRRAVNQDFATYEKQLTLEGSLVPPAKDE
jgi:RNA polymerase sigma factor (sigma-70 family)